MRRLLPLVVLLALAAPAALAQAWGTVEGRVTERGTGTPIPGASVVVDGTGFGTAAGEDGRFRLRLPEGRYALRVSAVGYTARTDSVAVRRETTTRLDVALEPAVGALDEVRVEARAAAAPEAGVSTLDPRTAQRIPTPLPDGLRAVQVLMGVASRTETSYQYSVRGGGYNENLFYIDGFEVFTPFRTRQGEQEGLGLVNLDLAEQMTLYAGGFPARFGGKLSSALVVTYLRPREGLGGSASVSALDAAAVAYGAALDGRVGLAGAVRAARPAGFFGSQELKGDYDPRFADAQGTLTLRLAEGHEVHALGLLLRHRFRLEPRQRRTTFGTFQDLRSVSFAFDGLEEDGYDLGFAGVRLLTRLGPRLRAEHELAWFDVREFERIDIAGNVLLARIDDVTRSPGDPANLIGTGTARQRDLADNAVRVGTLTAGGRYRLAGGRHATEAGWSLRRLAFDDRLAEGTVFVGRDTLGLPTEVALMSRGEAALAATQAALHVQHDADLLPERGRLVLTAGLRADYFSFNGEWTLAPRLSGRVVLDDRTALTAAAGLYHQAPTYRELRGAPILDPARENVLLDALNRDLRSQRAAVLVAGLERFFPRVRFHGRAEAYLKLLDRLVSYDVQHVRTVYSGRNDAHGYAAGFDLQLRGEFVPGLESWLNYGFLVARERFLPAYADERTAGWLRRPTDRRHNVSLFVQDYVPGSRDWRLHLRALYGSGTPFTPPEPGERIGGVDLQDPGRRASGTYPDYRRFDMGLTRLATLAPRGPSGEPVTLELTGEVLNVFNMTNTIAYAWIAGSDGAWQRVPTRLTPRQLNVRLRVRF